MLKLRQSKLAKMENNDELLLAGQERTHSTDKCDVKEEKRTTNVPIHLLERFKVIEKRTDDMTKRSREKRLKHLQKSIKEKVHKEITLPEDREILRKYDVKFGPSVNNKKRSFSDEAKDTEISNNSNKESTSKDVEVLNQYLGVNDHLKGINRGSAAPRSGLEKKIDHAIELGEFNTAEKLSDRLATREFGTKIADAFTAKDYIEKKKLEEKCSKRKKKKLNWGFEQKHRWETKSNM
ncbi:protein FAM204A-like [Mytilus edulis]|uniref:protein FAM204A-like n=1 Tax=Mytilus edulis TaxID=6550 RepID=UPI0039EE015D